MEHRFCLLALFAVSGWSSAAFTVLRRTTCGMFHARRESILPISSSNSDDVSMQESLSSSILKKDLLSVIPELPFGAPATNLTTSPETCLEIERKVSNLELLTPLPPLLKSAKAVEVLDGDWQLIYSDASEITRISKLPLGFRLGPVFQPIDVAAGRFENQAFIKHRLLLVSGHTRVVADFFLAALGETNSAGVVNIGERANVKFQKIIFTLRRLLVLPTFGKIRKTAVPNGPAEQKGIIPCIDVTYLDDTFRISRGGDGSLFILTRPCTKKPLPMLSKDTVENIVVGPESPTFDASVDILPSPAFKTKHETDAVADTISKQPIDISIPYDAAAKLAYESSDKSMDYPAFKIKFEADAVADIIFKQPIDVSIPYDAAAKLAYQSSDKSMDYPTFKTKFEADAVADIVAKKVSSL